MSLPPHLHLDIDQHPLVGFRQYIELGRLSVRPLRVQILVEKEHVGNLRRVVAVQDGVQKVDRQMLALLASQ